MDNDLNAHTPPQEGGLYLKLEDNQKAKLRLFGKVYIYQANYQGKISIKYAWAAYNYDLEQGQVVQLSITTFKKLKALNSEEEWGNPNTYDITMKREGMGTDTQYHINPLPNKEPLTKEQEEAVKKVNIPEAIAKGNGNSEAVTLEEFNKTKTLPPLPSMGVVNQPVDDREAPLPDDDEVDLSEIPF